MDPGTTGTYTGWLLGGVRGVKRQAFCGSVKMMCSKLVSSREIRGAKSDVQKQFAIWVLLGIGTDDPRTNCHLANT